MPVLPSDLQKSKTFLELVADGAVEGHSFVDKFGENPDIDSGSGFETITTQGGLYAAPTAGRIHNVASTSIEDTGTLVSSGTSDADGDDSLIDSTATFITDGVAIGDVVLNDTDIHYGYVTAVTSETELAIGGRMHEPFPAGEGKHTAGVLTGKAYRVVTAAATGAPVMLVQGEDDDLLELSEFVILNGQSGVLTVGEYRRQFRAKVFGASAIGTISSIAQTDGTTTLQLVNGNNQTLMAVYTVPSNKYGLLYSWRCALSRKIGAASTVQIRIGDVNGIGYVTRTEAINSTGASRFEEQFNPPLYIEGGTDIWVNADSDTNDVGVSAGFTLVEVEK